MIKVITIFLLLITPLKLSAEVFNCKMTLTSDRWGTQLYELLLDTGEYNSNLYALSFDKKINDYVSFISELKSIGKIYMSAGHPYGFGKKDFDFYVQRYSENYYGGFITEYLKSSSSVVLKKINNKWEIEIYGIDINFDSLQRGVCS